MASRIAMSRTPVVLRRTPRALRGAYADRILVRPSATTAALPPALTSTSGCDPVSARRDGTEPSTVPLRAPRPLEPLTISWAPSRAAISAKRSAGAAELHTQVERRLRDVRRPQQHPHCRGVACDETRPVVALGQPAA